MPLDNIGPAWIFCPADRPERFEKAAAAADVVILDLEDGAGDKPAARKAIVDTPLDPARTVIRLNLHGTEEQRLDLEALQRTGYTTVMLPKCEAAEQVSALAPLEVVLIVETPLGALKVAETAASANAIGVMWGAEDLFGSLGGTLNRFPDGSYRGWPCTCARSRCWPPRPTASWHWIRSTSTSRISTGCAGKRTTPSPSGSTSRWPCTRRR